MGSANAAVVKLRLLHHWYICCHWPQPWAAGGPLGAGDSRTCWKTQQTNFLGWLVIIKLIINVTAAWMFAVSCLKCPLLSLKRLECWRAFVVWRMLSAPLPRWGAKDLHPCADWFGSAHHISKYLIVEQMCWAEPDYCNLINLHKILSKWRQFLSRQLNNCLKKQNEPVWRDWSWLQL